MTDELVLISHRLCPYVQRAAIALMEKGVPFTRRNVDLANKPQWFLDLSPLGKTPVLQTQAGVIFESAVILEYLEETQPKPLLPGGAFKRADARAWMEFGSAVLNDIAGFYSAPDKPSFEAKLSVLDQKFSRLETRLSGSRFFGGHDFGLVDATFGPIFRYFDVFDALGLPDILSGKDKTTAWRQALAARPSVRAAVDENYPELLKAFLKQRNSYLSQKIYEAEPA